MGSLRSGWTRERDTVWWGEGGCVCEIETDAGYLFLERGRRMGPGKGVLLVVVVYVRRQI